MARPYVTVRVNDTGNDLQIESNITDPLSVLRFIKKAEEIVLYTDRKDASQVKGPNGGMESFINRLPTK